MFYLAKDGKPDTRRKFVVEEGMSPEARGVQPIGVQNLPGYSHCTSSTGATTTRTRCRRRAAPRRAAGS